MSIRTLIAFAGKAGAGKDTAAHLMQDRVWDDFPCDAVVITGFAKRMKKALKVIFDIDFEQLSRVEKEAKLDWLGKSPREIMQSFGTEWGRSVHEDLWVQLLERQMYDSPSKHGEVWLLTDCRFPNEVAWVKRKGGRVLWIERDGIAPVRSHVSEYAIGPQDCDETVLNLGTREDLAIEVQRVWARHVAQMKVHA